MAEGGEADEGGAAGQEGVGRAVAVEAEGDRGAGDGEDEGVWWGGGGGG